MTANSLYFGDCLDVMREDIPDQSIDLIYLDPPFNSKRIYNAFMGGAQWVAFKDTWQWHEAVEDFHQVAEQVHLAPMIEGLRTILGEGPDLAYLSYMANRLAECHRVLKPTGSIYLHCDPTMSHYLKLVMDAIYGRANFRNEIAWCYTGPQRTSKHFPRKHDNIFFYSYPNATFNKDTVRVPSKWNELGGWSKKEVAKKNKGKVPEDWWPMTFGPNSGERLGYPTQKPLALLERILKASSNPGDVVLDPFCGCGTTLHAAQNLDRQWIGVDICVKACQVIEQRLRGSFDALWDDVKFVGMPKTRDDAKTLASYDPFRFERWAASLVDGMEYNKIQTGDKGIDGRGRLAIRKGQFVDLVSQVKGGSTKPADVQAFNGARQQANADLGFFTCFEERVTNGMRNAAASTGRFMNTPVVQIYTIEDFFGGLKPKMPTAA